MPLCSIDEDVRRVDAVEKASGKARYVSDYFFPGMLYARMLRSSVARGKIKKITTPKLPYGYYFITSKDIPEGGRNALHMISEDWRCFAEDSVRYVGETIGLFVGPERSVLASLERNTKVEYEEEVPAITIDDAIMVKGGPILEKGDVFCHLYCEKGEKMDKVFSEADQIIEETFETGFQEHVHLETNGALVTKEDGKYVFYISAQCPFYVRKSIAIVLGIKEDDIIIRQTTTGGAFGGKEHFPDVLAGPLLVAESVIGRPIKLIFDRREDTLFSVKRHPSKIIYKSAIKDGKITGVKGDIYYNAGAYLSSSYVVLQRGVFHANGVYDIPSTYLEGFGMATNTFPSCAFRGFGAPQTLFAIEMHISHIARRLGVDPVELKRSMFLKKGSETVTNGHIVEEVMLDKMLDDIASASDYWRKSREYGYGSGKGIGFSFYNHGGAFTGNGEQAIIKAHARLRKIGNSVKIEVGSTEMGQGFQTALRKIAATVLEIPLSSVDYPNPDTSVVPDSGPTAASRSTMIVGKLIERCAIEMKERWDEGDFSVEKEYEHPDGHPWDQATFRGDAYLGYGWGACCVELEVDKRTNEVNVLGIWSSHDIGKAIDEKIVHGQINGGILQSLGYASMEKLENKGGHFRQESLSEYVIPTSMDFPKQTYFIQDNPYEWGPFGAKGMGELVFNGADAAYVDALERALGIETFKIPLPAEDIEEALKRNGR